MSLLSDLMNNTLDEGYLRAAQKTAPAPVTPTAKARQSVTLVLVFTLAGLVLATAARQTQASAPAVAQARDELIKRVQAETEQADTLTRQLLALRAAVDKARGDALNLTSAGAAAQADLATLAAVSGVSPVAGPGIRIVVDDAPAQPGKGRSDRSTGRVLDTDMQRLLNGLWAAGAEAVSVNGQRLTQLTAVRSAGDAILVAYRPLSPPYEVLAIGDPDDLEVDFVDGPGGRWFQTLKTFGIRFNVTREQDLQLPGASGVTLRLAQGVRARAEGTNR
jgi:uncharacterized protein YlxW (UPF0749 family)